MVDFRINETVQIGEASKPRLPGAEKIWSMTGRCGFSPHRIGAVGNSAYHIFIIHYSSPVGEISESRHFTMVDFRINETLQTGAVRKPHLLGPINRDRNRGAKVFIYFQNSP